MMRRLLGAVMFSLLMAPTALLPEQDLSGNWESSFWGYRLVAQMHQSGDRIEGVALLCAPFGKEDVYHFSGTFRDGRVVVSHHEGHAFRGEVVSESELAGFLETPQGGRLMVRLHRH